MQRRAILYGAQHPATCIAEVFQHLRVIDRHYNSRRLVVFELVRAVTLLDLTGTWPTRAGASMAIHSGSRPRAQAWSRVMYDAYPKVDGLFYCSSMDANRNVFAFFERARSSIPPQPLADRALSDPVLHARLVSAALRFGYSIR